MKENLSMNLFTNKFLINYSIDLVCIQVNKLSDVTEIEIRNKFYTEGISYLPVFNNSKNQLFGVLSRKKLFDSLLLNEPFDYEKILTQSISIVNLDDPLNISLKKLKEGSGLLLKVEGEFTKFISSRTASDAFYDYAQKFIEIEKTESLIRDYITKSAIDFIEVLAEKNQHLNHNKKNKKIIDLTFYDYGLIFNKLWESLELYEKKLVTKKDFNKYMQELVEMRNDLFHFRNNITFNSNSLKKLQKILR